MNSGFYTAEHKPNWDFTPGLSRIKCSFYMRWAHEPNQRLNTKFPNQTFIGYNFEAEINTPLRIKLLNQEKNYPWWIYNNPIFHNTKKLIKIQWLSLNIMTKLYWEKIEIKKLERDRVRSKIEIPCFWIRKCEGIGLYLYAIGWHKKERIHGPN